MQTAHHNNKNVIISWWFLRGLGLIYFSAFASMSVQVVGLIGQDGILPLTNHLTQLPAFYQTEKYWHFPTIFWLGYSDAKLQGVCVLGMIAACLVIIDRLVRLGLVICCVLFLSLCTAGQDFTAFQWDALLLESGFLAIFLTWHSKIIVFLYRLLIARFMLMSGVVKIASGDPTWANLTALTYHYQTQPLPTPLAYYAHFLPPWFHAFCTATVLVIELIVPFAVFLPRTFRLLAAWSFVGLQVSIILTGNYNFFNLLTLLLCLFLFDDKDLDKQRLQSINQQIRVNFKKPGRLATGLASTWAGFVVAVLASQLWLAQTRSLPAKPLADLMQLASDFGLVNNYGPFAVMTTIRNEIIIEGTVDGLNWQEYQFKYKPGREDKSLAWIVPHNPRLDWQLWFVPLGTTTPTWFTNLLYRLLEASPDVIGLLANDPFQGHRPKSIRVSLYRYEFLSPDERAKTGNIWRRVKVQQLGQLNQ